jgi:hypothetical protein
MMARTRRSWISPKMSFREAPTVSPPGVMNRAFP